MGLFDVILLSISFLTILLIIPIFDGLKITIISSLSSLLGNSTIKVLYFIAFVALSLIFIESSMDAKTYYETRALNPNYAIKTQKAYVTGIILLLSVVIFRLVSQLKEIGRMNISEKALKKQAFSASSSLKSLMAKSDALKNENKQLKELHGVSSTAKTMKIVFTYARLIPVLLLACIILYARNNNDTVPAVVKKVVSIPEQRVYQDITKNCIIPDLHEAKQFMAAISTMEAQCSKMRIIGGPPRGNKDSQKRICMDDRFKITPGNCTVFSFGVNNDFSFEDDFAEFGCKVFSFDPTMDVDDYKRSENVQFYAIGISNYTGTKRIGMGNNWRDRKVDRFENIVKMVGMAGKPIDVLKLDVELCELDFFHDALFHSRHVLDNIKLLAVELHTANHRAPEKVQFERYKQFWPYLHYLRCAGFRLISQDSPQWREVVWAQEKQW